MPDELMNAFLMQLVENMDGISEAVRLLQQHYQVGIADRAETVLQVMERARDSEDVDGEEMRELLTRKSREGKADMIREILGLFQAEKLSDVAREHYPELRRMVRAI